MASRGWGGIVPLLPPTGQVLLPSAHDAPGPALRLPPAPPAHSQLCSLQPRTPRPRPRLRWTSRRLQAQAGLPEECPVPWHPHLPPAPPSHLGSQQLPRSSPQPASARRPAAAGTWPRRCCAPHPGGPPLPLPSRSAAQRPARPGALLRPSEPPAWHPRASLCAHAGPVARPPPFGTQPPLSSNPLVWVGGPGGSPLWPPGLPPPPPHTTWACRTLPPAPAPAALEPQKPPERRPEDSSGPTQQEPPVQRKRKVSSESTDSAERKARGEAPERPPGGSGAGLATLHGPVRTWLHQDPDPHPEMSVVIGQGGSSLRTARACGCPQEGQALWKLPGLRQQQEGRRGDPALTPERESLQGGGNHLLSCLPAELPLGRERQQPPGQALC